MKNTKLYVKYLQGLSEKDRIEFRQYLDSPFLNKHKTLRAFFARWEKLVLRSDPETEISPEKFVKGQKWAISRLPKLNSLLLHAFRDFRAVQVFLNDDLHRNYNTLHAFIESKTDRDETLKLYFQRAKELEQRPLNVDTLHHQLQLELLRIYSINSRTNASVGRDWEIMNSYLDNYYIIQKLRFACAAANEKMIFNTEGTGNFLNWVLTQVETNKEQLSDLAYLYYLTFRLITDSGAEDPFPKLLVNLHLKSHAIDPDEIRDLYSYALNYCLTKSNQGIDGFLEKTVSLYHQLLDEKILEQNGKLPPEHFKNIVSLSGKGGRTDWVDSFIENYANRLTDNHEGFAISYNRAVNCYHKKEYRKAISFFQMLINEFKKDIFYGLDARAYSLKSYFHLYEDMTTEEWDQMENLIVSFTVFIRRNEKLAPLHKQLYLNFVKTFRKLLELKMGRIGAAESLSHELTNDLAGKAWIVEQRDIIHAEDAR